MLYRPDIYILAGQSNMSGRGLLSELPIFENSGRILVYDNSGNWRFGAEPVDSAAGQVDSVSDDGGAAGASPAMSFANAMFSRRPTRYVGLVPCAKGATSIAAWSRSTSRSTLYGSMRARALEAAAYGTLRGLILFQGESDAASLSLATEWPGRATQFCADVRSDFGADFPIVMTVLGPNPSSPSFPAWDTMVSLQENMTLPDRVARVTAQDLTAQASSPEHLDTASLVTLGARYAEAMNALL